MALQHKTFVTGSLGNIIFYEFRGKPCARARPTKVRQTKATKAVAGLFGKAARYSKILRRGLKETLPFPKDKPMMYRLNKVLLDWLRQSMKNKTELNPTMKYLSVFEFNEESELIPKFKKKPVVDFTKRGKITLTIPALTPNPDLSAPTYTKSIGWTITAVSCNTKSQRDIPKTHPTYLEMEYSNSLVETQQIELPFTISSGDIVLVAISLRYRATRKGSVVEITDKGWLPAGVVGAMYKE